MPMQLRSRTVQVKTGPAKPITKAAKKTAAPRKSKSRSASPRKQHYSAAREALKKQPISKAHSQMVLDTGVAKIESLETTLKLTPATRRARRATLAEQIGRKGEARGASTRGWGGRFPQKGKERAALLEKCGSEAFLLPNKAKPGESKFPIVARAVSGQSKTQGCAIDCGGVQAAFNRAHQHGYAHVAALAQRVLEEKCPESKRAREAASGAKETKARAGKAQRAAAATTA